MRLFIVLTIACCVKGALEIVQRTAVQKKLRQHWPVFLDGLDDAVVTTTTVYRRGAPNGTVRIESSVPIPSTIVKCALGCHPDLVSLCQSCERVQPPACVRIRSSRPLVLNVTDMRWEYVQAAEHRFDPTDYRIVY